MKTVLSFIAALLCTSLPLAAQSTGDDFNDNSVDATKWGPDFGSGHGVLTEANQRLQYTASNPTAEDARNRPWYASGGPYNADWEVQIDLSNSTSPNQANQVNSFGIDIVNARDFEDEIYAELYASQMGGPPERKGFYASMDVNDNYAGEADTGAPSGLNPQNCAVRIVFNSTSKVLSVYYDLDVSDGYNWVEYGSFGVAGSGGANGNGDWEMSNSDQFYVSVYGYSEQMTVSSGQMWGDNFVATGFLAPPHDFAVISIKAPKNINLKAAAPALTKRVKVQIQNLSAESQVIPSMAVLSNLVSVTLSNLHTGCTPPAAILVDGPPNVVPKTLKPKGKMNVFFNVTFSTNCLPDEVKSSKKDPGHEDFSYTATLNPAALDGIDDTTSSNDVCPRPPNVATGDKGCGNKDAVTKQLGADVKTDVVLKK